MSRIILWAIGLLILLGMGIAACGALINDEDSLGRLVLITHECDPYYEPCGGDEYDQWNSDQRNHNRRNRGAFSPGPFDRSPVEMHDVCVSLDCSGRGEGRRDDRREPDSSEP